MRLVANGVSSGSAGTLAVLEGVGGALLRAAPGEIELLVPSGFLDRMPTLRGLPGLHPIERPGTARRTWWEQVRLQRIASTLRADVLLGLTNSLPLAGGGVRGRAVLIQNVAPFIGWAQRMYRGRERARLQALRWITVASVRRADVTFTFTEYGRNLVAEVVSGSHVVAVPPGLLPAPPDRGDRRSEAAYAVVVADLYRYKGVEDAIRALTAPALRDLRLHVCGAPMDRVYATRLYRLVADLGVSDRVRFQGSLQREQIFAEIRGATCLIQPTRLESFGLPLLEALQCEVPVVSTDIPVASELGGSLVRLYPSGDVEVLREQLVDLLEHGPGEGWSDKAHAWREGMHWEKAAQAILEAVRALS